MHHLKITKKAHYLIGLAIIGSLFILSLAACNDALTRLNAGPLPRLLTVIDLPEETSTRSIAVRQGGYAYVLNYTTNSIAVLDGPKLVTLMRMGARYDNMAVTEVAVHPQTGFVYVTDEVSDNIYVISNTQVITTITQPGVDLSPHSVIIHPNTGYVYVGDARAEPGKDTVAVVRIISGTQEIKDIDVGVGGVYVLRADPRSNRVYVGLSLLHDRPNPAMAAVIDGLRLVMTTTLGYNPAELHADYSVNDIAINAHTGEIALLENENIIIRWQGDQIERIRLGKDYGIGPLTTLGLDPKRDILYAGVLQSPYAIAIAPHQAPVQLSMVAGSSRIVYDATHDYIYTADYSGPSMSVIRGTTVLATLSTGGDGPADVGVDEQRGYIYVSNADSHSVAVFGYDQATVTPAFWQTFLAWIGQ